MFAQVYDDKASVVRTVLRRAAPSLEQVALNNAYGCVLGEASVPLLARELALVAALRVDDAERQAVGHERAALRLGATDEQLVQIRRVARLLKLRRCKKVLESEEQTETE